MKKEETKIYNEALNLYVNIQKYLTPEIDEIRKCLKIMEYFEDYEKCAHLRKIIQEKENNHRIDLE